MAKLREYIKTDKNGTKYYRERVPCWRCGNIAGGLYIVGTNNGHLVPSGLDNGVCWKCHGDGYIWETVKEYTPEHLAKLEKARARREAKRAAEREAHAAEIAAENARIEAERKAREEREAAERARIAAEKARSHYVGNIGDKIEITATVKRSFAYEKRGFYEWQTIMSHIHEFVDSDGNVFIWYSSASIDAEKGDTVTVRGTIKKHSEYDGMKQTVLTRCKVEKVNRGVQHEDSIL